MKKLSLLLLILTFTLLPAAARELQDSTLRYTLSPKIDRETAQKIEKELRRDKGVSRAVVSSEMQIMTITFNPAKTSAGSCLKTVEKHGFTATPLNDDLLLPVPGGEVAPPRPRSNAEAGAPENGNCSGHECEKQQPCPGHNRSVTPRGRQNSGNIEGAYREQGRTSEPRRVAE